MKTNFLFLLVLLTSVISNAQTTAFTFQGQLGNNGTPANGLFDFQISVLDAPSGGNVVGGPVTNAATGVTNGLFTTVLDFGADVFSGPPRWLLIAVRSTGVSGGFTPLSPLMQITATPYAITANSASNLLGTLSAARLPSTVVQNSATGVTLTGTFSGTFAGNGSALTGVIAASATGQTFVYAYDTTTQSASALNVFQNINVGTQSQVAGWTYGSGTFTCNQKGLYYVACAAEAQTPNGLGNSISLRSLQNGAVIGGSTATSTFPGTGPMSLSSQYIARFNSGDTLQFQFAGDSTDVSLVAPSGTPSFSVNMLRLQ